MATGDEDVRAVARGLSVRACKRCSSLCGPLASVEIEDPVLISGAQDIFGKVIEAGDCVEIAANADAEGFRHLRWSI